MKTSTKTICLFFLFFALNKASDKNDLPPSYEEALTLAPTATYPLQTASQTLNNALAVNNTPAQCACCILCNDRLESCDNCIKVCGRDYACVATCGLLSNQRNPSSPNHDCRDRCCCITAPITCPVETGTIIGCAALIGTLTLVNSIIGGNQTPHRTRRAQDAI